MTRVLHAILLTALLALPVRAQDASTDAIRGVIQSQIDAFLMDDFASAFSYASPSIRGIFETPDNFGAMVREGYPMVWRPSEVTFGELREIGGRLWQRVVVEDAQGRVHALDYQMIQTDGGWKINGVQLLRAPDVGV